MGAQELPTLKLSLPPMIESFPIAFAQDQGIFDDHGITVELAGIANRRDRNLALFTGAVDGALTDITSVLMLLSSHAQLKITSTAFEIVDDNRRYALMTHNFSGIRDLDTLLQRLDGKSRRTIGLLRETDMEYQTDLLIQAQGVELDESKQYADFEDLVLLATLLGQGSILAAVLPEPIGSYLEFITGAEETPVVVLADYRDQELVPSILAFQQGLIESDPQRIERFYQGYREVLTQLQNTPRDRVIEVGLDAALAFFFPGLTREELPQGAEDFLQEYLIPEFPLPRALKPQEFQEVEGWALTKGYIRESVPFELAYTDLYEPQQQS
jgi:NitT/TauT family transport system substrate-binding protein